MTEYNGGRNPVLWILLVLLILAVMQVSRPAQQQLPTYDGNTWSTQIHTEDNDTTVCIGWCADGGN